MANRLARRCNGYGLGSSKEEAREAALETASANLPVGVAFHVVAENFVWNRGSTSASTSAATSSGSTGSGAWVCNLRCHRTFLDVAYLAKHQAEEKKAEERRDREAKSEADPSKSEREKKETAKDTTSLPTTSRSTHPNTTTSTGTHPNTTTSHGTHTSTSGYKPQKVFYGTRPASGHQAIPSSLRGGMGMFGGRRPGF